MTKKRTALFLLVAWTAFFLSGCSLTDFLFGKKGDEIEAPAQTLAYEGMEQMAAENYRTAAETFQRLKDRYPYSKFALLAELKIADAKYLDRAYIEAEAAYLEFERLHPKNEAVPYAIYQQGMCSYMRMTGHDRDQIPSVKAIQTFARLQQTFPDSKFAARAGARIIEAQNSLAGHEFYVGEFYYNMKAYPAALGRFISLIKSYPDTGYHGRSLEYIRICREKIAAIEAKKAEKEAEKKEKEKPAAPSEPQE